MEVRRRLADAPDSARGMSEHESLSAAASIAGERGHEYIGTEHQLLAVIGDASLDEALLAADVREHVGAHVYEVFSKRSSDG